MGYARILNIGHGAEFLGIVLVAFFEASKGIVGEGEGAEGNGLIEGRDGSAFGGFVFYSGFQSFDLGCISG